jgi:hypothetical protein
LTTGSGAGTVEMLIDRPEPGRLAIVELIGTGRGSLDVRTEEETDTQSSLVGQALGTYSGRRPLRPEVTHLRIETSNRPGLLVGGPRTLNIPLLLQQDPQLGHRPRGLLGVPGQQGAGE